MNTFNEVEYSLPIDISSSGDNTIIPAPTDGRTICVDFIAFLPTTAVSVILKQGSTALTGTMPLDAKQAVTWESENNERGRFPMLPDTALVMNLSGNVQVSGIVVYRLRGN